MLAAALVLLASLAQPAGAQVVDAGFGAPYAADGEGIYLVGEGVALPGYGAAARYDVFLRGEDAANASLTAAAVSTGPFGFRMAAVGIPSFGVGGVSVEAFNLPLLAGSFTMDEGPVTAGLAIGGAFVPRVQAAYGSSSYGSGRLDPGTGFLAGGRLEYRGFELDLMYAAYDGTAVMGDATVVGGLEATLAAAVLRYAGFGVMAAWLSGSGQVVLDTVLSVFFDLPSFDGGGKMDARVVAAWGGVRFGRRAFSVSVDAAAGLAWLGGTALTATVGGAEETEWFFRFAEPPSVYVLLDPALEAALDPRLGVRIGRLVPLVWNLKYSYGNDQDQDTGGVPGPGTGTGTGGTISLTTILFSGIYIRCIYDF